ncbi:MOSC domain-containing protein [Thermocrispum municipale]|uniref:MOSC domain-containing protein n=1 Tax=Thermocrispum municipale TaxID=37926 RepID=UPI0004144BF0|nr:MOSC N-terminal beta barrel domain-containing protein [Thermocrispum municipale]
MPVPVVASLHCYPVKSCRGITLSAAELLPAGVRHDRTFALVDEHGRVLTQREYPALAAVAVSLPDEVLEVSTPQHGSLKIDIQLDGKRHPIAVFRYSGEGVDQGDDAATWFSDYLSTPCRLVRVTPEHERVATGETPGTAGFADGQALAVASTTSLGDLNARIVARGGEPVPMDRFRPNIVVDSWPEPFCEDRVRRMTVGGAELGYAKRDTRCAITLVDQATGIRRGSEPIRTLSSYRRDPENGRVAFAVKFNVVQPGSIAVGDRVDVLTWGPGLTPS